MTADQAIEQIAIVGMAGRFPKARSTDEYWANLRDGVDCISRLAVPELLADGVDPALLKRAEYVAAKGVLDEPGGFDAGFFGYSPREAELLDPQHRVFLECCWEALENSGRVPNRCPELVGLYAGSGLNSYFVNNVVPRDGFELGGAAGYQAYVASDKDFLATRVAYKLDFRGPSLTVQTACSTSLVAVTLACQALLSYQCDLALAGGVAISSPQRAGYLYQEGMILSPDGRCRPFDRNAGGTVLGNGAGVVVLKRLSEAIADGDDIRAVILGAAVNNDGAAKAGYTTPSIEGQRDVVRQAQALAGVEPASISYIEAHGTGTPVGDPIELAALREVFASVRGAKRCGIGSVKSNIGHLDAAAGVASLLKVVLALQNEQLPRTLHFEAANPELGLDDSCFFVVRETTEWKRGALPRRAGVSSFGIGGSNAHVILQEAPRRARSAESARAYHVLNLSARSASALQQLARAYVATLGRPDCPALADVCHTAATGRARFSQRLSVVASSLDDAKSKLQHHLAGESPEPGVVTAVAQTNPRIAFLFTGQGSQYAKMGLELYEGEEVYREAVERCLSALGGRGEQLRRLLLESSGVELDETEWTQPALLAVEWGLSELWRSWGVTATAVLGHSVGEYAAACVAGVLSIEEGMRLLSERGRLMQGTRAGSMLAVFAGPDWVREQLTDDAQLSVAAENADSEVVVSGEPSALSRFRERCVQAGIKVREVKSTRAFHSASMDPILAELRRAAAQVQASAGTLPFVSNVTGQVLREAPSGEYWCRQAREPVRFAAGLRELVALGCDTFLEIGPHPVLTALGQRTLMDEKLLWLPSLRRGQQPRAQMLASLGTLAVQRRLTLDWRRVVGKDCKRVALPSYPFQGVSLRTARRAPASPERAARGVLPGARLPSPLGAAQFEAQLGSAAYPISEHVISGRVIVPAAAFLAGLSGLRADTEGAFEQLEFLEPLVLEEGTERRVHTIEHSDSMDAEIEIASQAIDAIDSGAWVAHVRARRALASGATAGRPAHLDELRVRMPRRTAGEAVYSSMAQRGYDLGPSFRYLREIWDGESEALGLLEASDLPRASGEYQLPPGLIDACFQLFGVTWQEAASNDHVHVPFSIERFWYRTGHSGPYYCHALRHPGDTDGEVFTGDLRLYDGSGVPVAAFDGVCVRRVPASFVSAARSALTYSLGWTRQPRLTLDLPAAPAAWLVFGSAGGTGTRVVRELEQRGHSAVLATAAEQFAWETKTHVRLPPDDMQHFKRVVAEFLTGAALDVRRREVVYLSEFATERADAAPPDAEVQGALMALQAVVELDPSLKVRYVTCGVQATGEQAAALAPRVPEQAALWGLGRVASREHGDTFSGLVDIGLDEPASALVDLLLDPNPGREVVLRAGERWLPRLVRHLQAPGSSRRFCASASGSYLISGGLGGLGLAIARRLVERGARQLVLVQRSRASEAARVELGELQALGAQVHVLRADVTSEAEVAEVFRTIAGLGAPLRGIVHAAGVLDDGVLLQQTAERARRVMQVKALGARHLSRLSEASPLEFFVCVSSVASLFGAPGQATYAAANAYLDGLAWERRARGLPALSVNFGPWRDAGMAAALSASERSRFTSQGLALLPASAALEALEALLTSDLTQAAVLDAATDFRGADPAGVSPLIVSLTVSGADQRVQPTRHEQETGELLRRLRDHAGRRSAVRDFVREQAARVLGYPQSATLDVATPLRDLGLDSLMALSLAKAVGRGLDQALPPTLVFNHPSVEEITSYLLREHLPVEPMEPELEAPATEPRGDVLAEVRGLSESELGAAVDAELARLASDP